MKTVTVDKAEYLAALRRKKGNKYNAKKVKLDGRTFDSKAEASAAATLEMMRKAGRIREIEYQPRYLLLPKPNKIEYVADFRVVWADGREEIIDIKGMETPVFKIKHKMFRHFYPDKMLTITDSVGML